MDVVERFLRERPLSYEDAMQSSPAEHLREFWQWIVDQEIRGKRVSDALRAASKTALDELRDAWRRGRDPARPGPALSLMQTIDELERAIRTFDGQEVSGG